MRHFQHFDQFVPFPSLFPSQFFQTDRINPDDIDLENEPWYKFFSELEFGRPVSEARIPRYKI